MFESILRFNPALPSALIVGLFGGVGLVLVRVYTRKGPLVFPVYAAMLFSLALLLSRYDALRLVPRIVAALAALALATSIAFVSVLILASRERRLHTGGLPVRGMPRWGLPLVCVLLLLASIGVAYVAAD